MCAAIAAPALASSTSAAEPEDCEARRLEYTLSARIRLTDTPFGAGNGTFDIGPGRLVLRLTPLSGSPETFRAELLDYSMQSTFTVRAKVFLWRARVVTRAESRVADGIAGRGTLSRGKLTWSTPIRGHQTYGTMTCSGSGCGLPGAPPKGQGTLQIGPEPVRFAPFVFAGDDLETFQMAFSKVTHTEEPEQTTALALAGRKVNDRCIAVARR